MRSAFAPGPARRLSVAIGVVIAMLAVFGLAYRMLVVDAIEGRRLGDAGRRLNLLREALLESESSSRGYALSGDPTFLGPLEEGTNAVQEQFPELKNSLRGDAEASALLDDIETSARRRMSLIHGTVRVRRREGLPAVAALTSSGEGRRLMDRIRSQIETLDGQLRSELEERRERISSMAWSIGVIVVGGSLLLLLFLFDATRASLREPRAANSLLDPVSDE